MSNIIFATEHIQFLRDNAKGKSNAELTALFNARFGTKKSIRKIACCKNRNAIYSGICSKFKPNHVPCGKGSKGKKNHKSLPIGTERITGGGAGMS